MLAVTLTWSRPRHQLEEIGKRRMFTLLLFGVISVGNGVSLIALIGSLLMGHEDNGAALIYKGITIWTANMISFGLWYWIFDRGGPVRRREPDPPPPDFQFPQMENPSLAEPGWHPRLFDYIYVSYTNSIAFSPTDAMPHDPPGEAADADPVGRVGDHGAAGRGAWRQHPRLKAGLPAG